MTIREALNFSRPEDVPAEVANDFDIPFEVGSADHEQAERTFADDYEGSDDAADADYFEREEPDSDSVLGLCLGGPY